MVVEIKRKILLLGDGAVGKTSLIRKFVTDQFDDKYIASIGTKVTKKVINFKLKDDELNLVLLIWDILGQSDFKGVIGASFYGASGAFLVADMTRRPTLENLKKVWLPRVEEVAKDLPIVFLGNKADLEDQYAFREKDIAELADTYDAPHFLTSAKTGLNVNMAFYRIAYEVAKKGKFVDKQLSYPIPEEGRLTLVEVADWIMYDFCSEKGEKNFALTMPIVREQYERAGVDPRNPTKEAIMKAIKYLAEIEALYLSQENVERNALKRLKMLKRAVSKNV